jgi:signal peptidase I
MDDDDLRTRLDAQIAARRASGERRGKRRRVSEPKTRNRFTPLIRLVTVVALAAAFTFVLRTFVLEPFYVPSESMETTLHGCSGCQDDYLLVNKLSYHLHSVHDGDIVVFSRPPDLDTDDSVLVKRVIAVGGQTVSIKSGRVFVDGKQLTEKYINPACQSGTTLGTEPATVAIPKGDVWVMGDNRCDSKDSRYFGPIKASTIVGRAFVVVWPLSRIHLL